MNMVELTPGKDCNVIIKPTEIIEPQCYADNSSIALIRLGIGFIIQYKENGEEKCIKVNFNKQTAKAIIRQLKKLCRVIR